MVRCTFPTATLVAWRGSQLVDTGFSALLVSRSAWGCPARLRHRLSREKPVHSGRYSQRGPNYFRQPLSVGDTLVTSTGLSTRRIAMGWTSSESHPAERVTQLRESVEIATKAPERSTAATRCAPPYGRCLRRRGTSRARPLSVPPGSNCGTSTPYRLDWWFDTARTARRVPPSASLATDHSGRASAPAGAVPAGLKCMCLRASG